MINIFKHYKGDYYKVLHIGVHTKTKESMVVYQQLHTNKYPKDFIWIRPYEEFMDNVVVNHITIPRFTKCPDDYIS